MDVLLEVGPGRTRAAAVERALRRSILSGQLAPGTRVPSSRELASELGCARATIVAAYEQLAAEGYLLAAGGSGTTVATVRTTLPTSATASPNPFFTELLPGEPDPSSFPRQAWAAALRKVLHSNPDSLLRYGDRQGLTDLRVALASYLARSRSVVVDPSRVVIFGGFASALSVLATTFHRLGISRVAVEDPGLPPHKVVIAASGPTIVPIPVDDDGLCVGELGEERAVLCTPAHQYPMGVVLSAARRVALIEWARERDGWIIEDDYDGEFRYDRRPIGARQGLDPDRVVYGGTASKSLAPGLGLAWLVLPPMLLEPVLDTMRLRRDAVSSIEQAALADFIASGRLDRHVRAQRLHYRRRRDAMMAVLADKAPWLEVTGVSAGLHVTALLGDRDEAEVIGQAARRSVALFGIANHSTAAPMRHGLVIGYSRSAEHAFPQALETLATVLDAC
ncbi:MAG: GntR family transcriptional regulator / MocR family aminotransferase [Actinomycetota bacterium]